MRRCVSSLGLLLGFIGVSSAQDFPVQCASGSGADLGPLAATYTAALFEVFASGNSIFLHSKGDAGDDGVWSTHCVQSVGSVIPVAAPSDGSPAFAYREISTLPPGASITDLPACWIQYLDASGATPQLLYPAQYGPCPAPENVTSPAAIEAATVSAYSAPPPCPTQGSLPDFFWGTAADTSQPAGDGSSTNVTFAANFTVRITHQVDATSGSTIRSVESVCLGNISSADDVVPNAWFVTMSSDALDLYGSACFLLWRDPDAAGLPLYTLRQYWSLDAATSQPLAACPSSLSISQHKDLIYVDGAAPMAAPPSPTPNPSYTPAATATPSAPPAAASASPASSISAMPSPGPAGEPAFPYACPASSGPGLIQPQYHASFVGSGSTWHVGETSLLFVPASGSMMQTYCVVSAVGPSTITPDPSSGLGPSPYEAIIITTNNDVGIAQDFCVVMLLTPTGEPANLFAPGPNFCTEAALASFPGSPESQVVSTYNPPNSTFCPVPEGDLAAVPAYLIGTAVQNPSGDSSLPTRNVTLASSFTLTRISYSYTVISSNVITDVVLGSSCVTAVNSSSAWPGAVQLTAAVDGPVTCSLLVRPDSNGPALQAFFFEDAAMRMDCPSDPWQAGVANTTFTYADPLPPPAPTLAPSPSPSEMPTETSSSTATPSTGFTETSTGSPSGTSSSTATPSTGFTETSTGSPSGTSSSTATPSTGFTETSTGSPSGTSSSTATPSTGFTETSTGSPSGTSSSTATPSTGFTETSTGSPSGTSSSTATPSTGFTESTTGSLTATATSSGSQTASASLTASETPTASVTASGTPTASVTASETPTASISGTSSGSGSETPTATLTASSTATGTASSSSSLTATSTATSSASASLSAGASPSPSTSPIPSGLPLAAGVTLDIPVALPGLPFPDVLRNAAVLQLALDRDLRAALQASDAALVPPAGGIAVNWTASAVASGYRSSGAARRLGAAAAATVSTSDTMLLVSLLFPFAPGDSTTAPLSSIAADTARRALQALFNASAAAGGSTAALLPTTSQAISTISGGSAAAPVADLAAAYVAPTPPLPPPAPYKPKPFPGGGIAAIVVVLLALIGGASAYFLMRKRRKLRRKSVAARGATATVVVPNPVAAVAVAMSPIRGGSAGNASEAGVQLGSSSGGGVGGPNGSPGSTGSASPGGSGSGSGSTRGRTGSGAVSNGSAFPSPLKALDSSAVGEWKPKGGSSLRSARL